jgi:hypothetical protein
MPADNGGQRGAILAWRQGEEAIDRGMRRYGEGREAKEGKTTRRGSEEKKKSSRVG